MLQNRENLLKEKIMNKKQIIMFDKIVKNQIYKVWHHKIEKIKKIR